MNQQKEGTTVLGHDGDPGYKKIFYAVCFISILYLVFILLIA